MDEQTFPSRYFCKTKFFHYSVDKELPVEACFLFSVKVYVQRNDWVLDVFPPSRLPFFWQRNPSLLSSMAYLRVCSTRVGIFAVTFWKSRDAV